jgi:uncharacterized membrane protein YbhN (UPF0104 family)
MRKSALAITTITFSLLGYYLYRNSADLSPTLKLNPLWLFVLCLIMLVRCYLNALINKIALDEVGARLERWESFSLTTVGSAIQMFLPLNGGAVFRAVYLKRRYQLAYSHFLSTQLGIQIVGVFFTCLAAMVALSLVANLHEPEILGGMALCGSCFLASLIVLSLPPLKRRNHRIWDKLAMLSEGCQIMRTKRPLLLKMILISIAKTVSDALIFWCGSLSMGLNVNFLGAIALTSVASLAVCFRVTPGALGTYEALIGMVSQAALLSSAQAVAVSLVVRGVTYAVVAVLFPLCTWWLVAFRGLHWNLRESPLTESSLLPDAVSRAA